MSNFPFFFYNYFDTLMNIGYYKITYFYYEEGITYMYTILLTDDEQSEIRNKQIGFIFQGFNLIPSLTAIDNVELPLVYRGMKKEERIEPMGFRPPRNAAAMPLKPIAGTEEMVVSHSSIPV